jgi:hypothetical protein
LLASINTNKCKKDERILLCNPKQGTEKLYT